MTEEKEPNKEDDIKLNEEHIITMKRFCPEIKDINTKNECGWTPLYRCIIGGDLKSTEALIQLGADPNIQCNMDETPLYQAVSMEKNEHVKLLLNYNANANLCQSDGLTPLHCAVLKKNVQIVELLLSSGANPNIKSRFYLQTPVHFAIKNNVNPTILLLLVQYNGSLVLKDKDMKRPIDYVNSNEMRETLKKLRLQKEHIFKTPQKEKSLSFGNFNKLSGTFSKLDPLKYTSDSKMRNIDVYSNTVLHNAGNEHFNFLEFKRSPNSEAKIGKIANKRKNQNEHNNNESTCHDMNRTNLEHMKRELFKSNGEGAYTGKGNSNYNQEYNKRRTQSQFYLTSDKKHFIEPSYSPIRERKEKYNQETSRVLSKVKVIEIENNININNKNTFLYNEKKVENDQNGKITQNPNAFSYSLKNMQCNDILENKENINMQNENIIKNDNNNNIILVNQNKEKENDSENNREENLVYNRKTLNNIKKKNKGSISLRDKYYNSQHPNSICYQSSNNYLCNEQLRERNKSIIPSDKRNNTDSNINSNTDNSEEKTKKLFILNIDNKKKTKSLNNATSPIYSETNQNIFNKSNISNIEYSKNTNLNSQTDSVYYPQSEKSSNKFSLYTQNLINLKMIDTNKLYEWLKEIRLLCYYQTFIENGIYILDYLILDMKNEKVKINYNDIEELGIKKPGHIYRILTKLEIDAELCNPLLYEMIKKARNSNANVLNVSNILISNEYCCGCNCLSEKKKIKGNGDYYELTSWLKKINLLHLKTNFSFNGFEMIEFFVLQMFSSVPIDHTILKEHLHIYSERERSIIIMQLNNDAKFMVKQINGDIKEGDLQREIEESSCKMCRIF